MTTLLVCGDRVRKVGGSFQHTGVVVAVFSTTRGETRIVLEFDDPVGGMLHIYRPDQVERLPNCPECGGTGAVDSGGFTPWGQGIDVPCHCVRA